VFIKLLSEVPLFRFLTLFVVGFLGLIETSGPIQLIFDVVMS